MPISPKTSRTASLGYDDGEVCQTPNHGIRRQHAAQGQRAVCAAATSRRELTVTVWSLRQAEPLAVTASVRAGGGDSR